MRRYALLVTLVWLCWAATATATAATASAPSAPGPPGLRPVTPAGGLPGEQELARAAGVEAVDRLLAELDRDVAGYAPRLRVSQILAGLWRGDYRFDYRGLWRGATRYLFGETLANLSLLGRLVALAVVGALLHVLQSSFGGEGTGRLSEQVVYLVLAALALSSFGLAFATARETVGRLVSFMEALLPTLLALLVANGALASGGLFHPLVTACVYVASALTTDLVLPLVMAAGVLEMAGGFARGFKLSGMVNLLRLGAVTVLGLAMSAFLGVAAVYRAAGAIGDGVALRTTKFLATTFVPVIGKMFADAAEVIMGTGTVLAGAVGLAGALGVLVMVLFPLLKLAAVIITYRLAGAVVQPVDGIGLGGMLNGIANTISIVFVTVAAVGMWFFIAVAILMGSASGMALRGS